MLETSSGADVPELVSRRSASDIHKLHGDGYVVASEYIYDKDIRYRPLAGGQRPPFLDSPGRQMYGERPKALIEIATLRRADAGRSPLLAVC